MFFCSLDQFNLIFIVICIIFVVLGDFHHHPPLNSIITTQDIIAGDVFFEITDPYSLEYTYRLRPAKDFGTPFRRSLEGVALVPTVPPDACTPIINKKALNGNVAFIDRGYVFTLKSSQYLG